MARIATASSIKEFGDFQTPLELAQRTCALLADRGLRPASVLEPTCGVGNFILAALDRFPETKKVLGVEINGTYVAQLAAALQNRSDAEKVQVIQTSFFDADWAILTAGLPQPILVLGNPPWVTNANLGALGSGNLPKKSNFQNHTGMDAMTGKSNFDISEWMLIKLLERLEGRRATIAMLCKTAVARKVLSHAWQHRLLVGQSEMHVIDAATSFGAAVDACLLICHLGSSQRHCDCRVFARLGDEHAAATIGYHDDQLVADIELYNRWKHLGGREVYRWRSGIKHDCSKVMELRRVGDRYINGYGESVDLEEEYLFPMLKGSKLANGQTERLHRWMIVPQRSVGDDTDALRARAPKTWDYLEKHGSALDRRASSIYRKRPRFSVFGVGDYAFSPWKVAIPGLYKTIRFAAIGNVSAKPIVFDDTCYFVPCQTQEEAEYIASLLNSSAAREFLSALIFWDAKRPITIDVLRRLDLTALARALGSQERIDAYLAQRATRLSPRQMQIFKGD